MLADSSVWIDHLRTDEPGIRQLLNSGNLLGHPLVAGEIAVGSMRNRAATLYAIDRIPQAQTARHSEVRQFLELHKLHGRGVGFADLHLLVSVRLTQDALLWTRDRRLHEVADEMGFAYVEREARPQ